MSNVRDYTHRPAAEAAEGTRPAGQAESDSFCTPPPTYEELARKVAHLNPFDDSEAKKPEEPTALFLWGARYYLGMLEDGDNPHHAVGHIQEVVAEFERHLDSLRKAPAGVEPPVVAVAGREASAAVERRHREAAVAAYSTEPIAPMFMTRWVESDGILSSGFSQAYRQLTAIAQALADAEAYGRASALEKP